MPPADTKMAAAADELLSIMSGGMTTGHQHHFGFPLASSTPSQIPTLARYRLRPIRFTIRAEHLNLVKALVRQSKVTGRHHVQKEGISAGVETAKTWRSPHS
jgi:hypothetical protein